MITRNCDARVDSTLQFYLQRSFPLREMRVLFTPVQFLLHSALSVSVLFLLSFSSMVMGGRDECYAHTAGAYAFLQGSASCSFCLHLQHQSQAVRHVRCPWLHASPLFLTLLMGTQHIPEPPIAPVRKWYQGLVTTNNPAQP